VVGVYYLCGPLEGERAAGPGSDGLGVGLKEGFRELR
jgi:hypothetical protein